MQSARIAIRPGMLLSASLVALALIAAPLAIDNNSSDFGMAKAWAKNGNGNGGGHGNGNGNGHGNGNGKANGHDKTANAKSKASTVSDDDANVEDDDTASASELGALNAAHVSPTALANASPNSRVGKIAAYKEAEVA